MQAPRIVQAPPQTRPVRRPRSNSRLWMIAGAGLFGLCIAAFGIYQLISPPLSPSEQEARRLREAARQGHPFAAMLEPKGSVDLRVIDTPTIEIGRGVDFGLLTTFDTQSCYRMSVAFKNESDSAISGVSGELTIKKPGRTIPFVTEKLHMIEFPNGLENDETFRHTQSGPIVDASKFVDLSSLSDHEWTLSITTVWTADGQATTPQQPVKCKIIPIRDSRKTEQIDNIDHANRLGRHREKSKKNGLPQGSDDNTMDQETLAEIDSVLGIDTSGWLVVRSGEPIQNAPEAVRDILDDDKDGLVDGLEDMPAVHRIGPNNEVQTTINPDKRD